MSIGSVVGLIVAEKWDHCKVSVPCWSHWAMRFRRSQYDCCMETR